jgi:hypothetical protein
MNLYTENMQKESACICADNTTNLYVNRVCRMHEKPNTSTNSNQNRNILGCLSEVQMGSFHQTTLNKKSHARLPLKECDNLKSAKRLLPLDKAHE